MEKRAFGASKSLCNETEDGSVVLDGNPFFDTFFNTVMNMFLLVSTSNYPEIMQFSLNQHRSAFIFFFLFISLNFIFILNLLIAVVYENYSKEDFNKFKKMFMHKREASARAFQLLVTRENPQHIHYVHFSEFIPYFSSFPRFYPFSLNYNSLMKGTGAMSPRDKLLIFKMLNKSNTGYLTMEEFHSIYESLEYTWVAKEAFELGYLVRYQGFQKYWKQFSIKVRNIVLTDYFNWFIQLVVVLNVIYLIADAVAEDKTDALKYTRNIVSLIFVIIFFIEMVLKLIALGVREYFKSYWNILDFVIAWAGPSMEILRKAKVIKKQTLVMAARSVKLLTLFKVRKTFREVFETLALMAPRILTVSIFTFLVFFFFGTLGVELFKEESLGKLYKIPKLFSMELNQNIMFAANCCNGSIVETHYDLSLNGNITYKDFDHLYNAYMILFELLTERSWEVPTGYAEETSGWAWIYFVTFHIVAILIMTYTAAFILHTFILMNKYKQKTKRDDGEVLSTSITLVLNRDEVKFLDAVHDKLGLAKDPTLQSGDQEKQVEMVEFHGDNVIVAEELLEDINRDQIAEWMEKSKFLLKLDESIDQHGVDQGFGISVHGVNSSSTAPTKQAPGIVLSTGQSIATD